MAFSPTVSFLNGLILIILNKKDPMDIISKFTVGSEEGISDLITIILLILLFMHYKKNVKTGPFQLPSHYFGTGD